MPTLANPRHEAFAVNRAQGQNQHDAYLNAGFDGNPSAASQLANRPEVRSRIQELYAEKAQARRESDQEGDDSVQDLNKDWILKQLKQNISAAQSTGQISAANKSVELIMDLLGFTKKSKATPDEPDDSAPSTVVTKQNDRLNSALDKLDALRGSPVGDDA